MTNSHERLSAESTSEPFLAWLDGQIEEAAAGQKRSFASAGLQNQVQGERWHARQAALYEAKMKFQSCGAESNRHSGAVGAEKRAEQSNPGGGHEVTDSADMKHMDVEKPLPDEPTPAAGGLMSDVAQTVGMRAAELEKIGNKAREWASHYPQSSDGRNTFILFAEWVEALVLQPPAAPVETEGKEWVVPHEDCLNCTCIEKCPGWKELERSSAESTGELTSDFAQALPGGKMDDSTYAKIEDALDRINAPCTDASGKWLSLHERIAALPPMPDEPQPTRVQPREMWAMLYLNDWEPPKEGQEHRWEPGKNVFPAIHNVYETIRDANAVLSRMSDPKKYWVCRVWMPAHDTPALSRPERATASAPDVSTPAQRPHE